MKNNNLNILLDLIKSQCYEYRDSPFKLSSGHYSNHYFDFRNLLSSPDGFYYVGEVLSEILIKQILNNKIYPIDMDNYIPKCRMTPYETCYKSLDIQAIGGMAVGSISVSNAILANLLYKHNININTFYVRKVDKSHGKAGRVVGMVEKGVKVTIVDDVITTGRSINAAIEFIQSERNSIVVAVLSIIDRQEGGSETITEKYNIPVISAFTMTDILGVEDKN